jgi:hypothetical protein
MMGLSDPLLILLMKHFNISIEICTAGPRTIALYVSGEWNFTGPHKPVVRDRFYVRGGWIYCL